MPAPPSHRALAERRVGATLRDKYRIERVLGVGGMATVYLGVHRNGHKVAVKILHPELSQSASQRERFIREGYVANSIEHPGAVRVLDDDVAEDGCPFLVIELLDGSTLEERRRRAAGKLELREVLAIGYALCDALAAAHDKGVIHRDIKPENVFIRADGSLKILDFGIAKVISEEAVLGGLAGTPAFMPPEQALGDIMGPVDARADLWAAGATMFTLLTGRFVHDGSRTTEFLMSTVTKSAPSLLDVAPDMPQSVANIIDTALAYDRDERFVDAREMRDAIGDAYHELFGEALGVTLPRGSAGVLFAAGPSSMRPPPGRSSMRPPVSLRSGAPSARNHQISIQTLTDVPPTLPGNSADATIVDKHPPHEEPPPSISGSINTSGPESTIAPPTLSGAPPPRTNRPRAVFAMAAGMGMLLSMAVLFGVRAARQSHPTSSDSSTPQACLGSNCAKSGCSSNAECVAETGGKPAVCRKDTGICIKLETDQCRVLADKSEVENDTTIWIGAMYPYGPKGSTYGKQSARAIELARKDFKEIGGIPAVALGGKPRPLGVVLCDDSEHADPAAKHLVETVNVPVILGFARSKEVMDLANAYFLQKGVFALASNTANMLADIGHAPGEPRLVLRATISAGMINPPKAALVDSMIEPLLRARRVLRAHEPMRIAIIRSNNASGVSHADQLLSHLQKNGKVAVENSESVQQFVVPDELERNDKLDALFPLADSVGQFAPHVVLEAGTDLKPFLAIEQRWPNKTKLRPTYVTMAALSDPTVERMVKERPDATRRMFSVNSTVPPALTKFIMHHNEIFTDEKLDAFNSNSAPYDAFYAAAYAIIALGDEPITGKALARSIRRLVPPGESIDVGQAGMYRVVKLLRDGQNVDLNGSQTSLDFNPETGDPTGDFSVRCFDPVKKTVVESGLIFSAKSGKLEGTSRCP